MSGVHLVTGGSGYFGGVLVRRLHERGASVRVFDLVDSVERPAGVELIRGDIRDPAAVRRAVRGVEVVHHNVAQVPLAKDRARFVSVNRDGTEHLLRACLEEGVRKVVHTSSSAVFGAPAHNPVTEETPPRPQEDYGRAKLEAERLCARYAADGVDVTIVRPRTILGHGRLGIVQILFEWIREGRNVPVLGDGGNRYQFVHADDLADACLRAAERPGSDLFHVGAERFGTMREALEGLITHAGTRSRIVPLPVRPAVALMTATSRLGLSPLGPYHALLYGREMFFDVSKARRLLGWSARHGNVEMLCESYDWYLAHRDEVLAGRGGSPHTSATRQGILRVASWLLGLAR